jgi:hypothetical protein
MNTRTAEEIAAAVGAHRDLGPGYDDAVAAGLVERIGAEIDLRVDARMSQYQRGGQPAQHLPAVHSGGQISWQQVILAFGSMVIGAIASGTCAAHGNETWPIIFIWIALVVINLAIFRAGRPVVRR